MGAFNEYPYVDHSTLNLDWILDTIKNLRVEMTDFVNVNTLKYADPILWNITTQYEQNTIVQDNSGNTYMSKKAVPQGVNLNNTDFWLKVADFASQAASIKGNIAKDEENGPTASKAYAVNELLWWKGDLYKTLTSMSAGTAFVSGTNVSKCTVAQMILNLWTQSNGDHADIATLNATLTQHGLDITALQGNVVTINGNITALDGRVTALEGGTAGAAGYATVAIMKADESLEAGAVVNTFGYYAKGDKGAATYIIEASSTTGCESLDNGLYAKIINDDITPYMVGCYGDGDQTPGHDDTTKFSTYLDIVMDRKIALHIPVGCSIKTAGFTCNLVQFINIEGSLIGNAANQKFNFYMRSQDISSAKWYFGNVENSQLVIAGVKNGQITINKADKVLLWARNMGSSDPLYSLAYNVFKLGNINDFEIGTDQDSTSTPWVNENTFIGGNIKNSFKIDGCDLYYNEHNRFYDLCIESASITSVYFNRCRNNYIYGGRFENVPSGVVTFGTKASSNVIFKSHLPYDHPQTESQTGLSFVDNNGTNVVKYYGDTFNEFFTYSCDPHSNNYNTDVIYKDDTNPTQTLVAKAGTTSVFETGYIDITQGISFQLISDAAVNTWSVKFLIYDENFNAITTQPTTNPIAIPGGVSWQTNGYIKSSCISYDNMARRMEYRGNDSGVKYVRIVVKSILTGTDTSSFKTLKCIVGCINKKAACNIKKADYMHGTSAPANGKWAKGDIVINDSPAAGGAFCWVCTTAGAPGTWKAVNCAS